MIAKKTTIGFDILAAKGTRVAVYEDKATAEADIDSIPEGSIVYTKESDVTHQVPYWDAAFSISIPYTVQKDGWVNVILRSHGITSSGDAQLLVNGIPVCEAYHEVNAYRSTGNINIKVKEGDELTFNRSPYTTYTAYFIPELYGGTQYRSNRMTDYELFPLTYQDVDSSSFFTSATAPTNTTTIPNDGILFVNLRFAGNNGMAAVWVNDKYVAFLNMYGGGYGSPEYRTMTVPVNKSDRVAVCVMNRYTGRTPNAYLGSPYVIAKWYR